MDYDSIRPAFWEDCEVPAEIYRIASGSVADCVWSKSTEPGETPLSAGCRHLAREGTPFSYQNAHVVERNGSIVGMLLAYPLHLDTEDPEEDPVLTPYAALEEDNSFYISGLTLFPEFRSGGVGTRLLFLKEPDSLR